ncbi:MAG TPA: cysteine ABC transporter substrate-binding protein [Candidatus Anaerostipes avistercoris]|uniref:Cysteine ABC transporter substrate-binding protein n=1 Tax=Candidatus Anaerostipes avistercoris TaxID=2838462 RepID=A0A9D2PI70_9FIRM|nr:cysteine ABC transporter substrate-binding protein [Candidatus Anaerostipes avistercoris]
MKKRTIMLLGLITLAAVWTACGKNGEKDSGAKTRTLQEIRDSKEIVIGVFSDKKPFGYVDENGTYQGYDVYFGRRLAKDLGVKVKYVPVEAASRVEYLRSGKVDLILANFTVTDERKEQVDFALPYMKVSLGVVSPEDQLITKESQLDGKTLIVSKGTTAEAYFMKNRPEVKLLKFDQYSEAFQALKDGRGDALATDNTEVLAWAIENEGFKVGIESLGNTDVIAPAVQKGNEELLSWLNEEIKTLGEEQFFHENYEKTLRPVYGESADPENLVVEGGKVE